MDDEVFVVFVFNAYHSLLLYGFERLKYIGMQVSQQCPHANTCTVELFFSGAGNVKVEVALYILSWISRLPYDIRTLIEILKGYLVYPLDPSMIGKYWSAFSRPI